MMYKQFTFKLFVKRVQGLRGDRKGAKEERGKDTEIRECKYSKMSAPGESK